MIPAFEGYPKIGRLDRTCIVTEKIDGTNAQIYITDEMEAVAGSRNRWLLPGQSDNFGFAAWVNDHAEELVAGLGAGRHFGEWWGSGIQRGYGLLDGEKRFSLFNTTRWSDPEKRPKCCGVVPVLLQHTFNSAKIDAVLAQLAETGSVASPGFMKPEGIVVFHTASSTLYKKTLDGDGAKGER